MQPLKPEDLIIRQPAPDGVAPESASPSIPLERYQELERVIGDIPLTSEPYLELAEIYRQAKRWNDARRVLEKAAGRFPDDLQTRHLLEESQIARSTELCVFAEKEHSAEPTQLTQEKLDRCRLELNVLRERVFRDRLQRHPDQLELTLPLAEALEQLDRRDEAIELLRTASEKPELRATASLQLGKLLELVHRVPEALSAYRQAALYRVPPPSPSIQWEALHRAADLAERNQMIDSARRYLTYLSELQPDRSEIRDRLSILQHRSL